MANETLFDYLNLRHNSTLEFIDATTGISKKFDEIVKKLPDFSAPVKKLVFLYLDNSIESVIAFLALLKSNHAICLLNSSLNISFKQKLEAHYKPSMVFDSYRNDYSSGTTVIYDNSNMKGYEFIHHSYPIAHHSINSDLKILLSTSGTTGSPKVREAYQLLIL
jgi:acyl-coenzyme A synthetase/AMP-(fatty) acid ligase